MLGSGSAGNSALVATDHCKVLIDGGLSARQLVLRLELCGVTPEQLDGVLLTHEHGDHICGLEVLCRKFNVPIYSNALTAESVRGDGVFEAHRNWLDQKPGAKPRYHGPRRGVQDLLVAGSADSGCLAVRGGAIGVTSPVRAAHRHAATGWPL